MASTQYNQFLSQVLTAAQQCQISLVSPVISYNFAVEDGYAIHTANVSGLDPQDVARSLAGELAGYSYESCETFPERIIIWFRQIS